MNGLTDYQIINQGGKPAFVVIPYDEFVERYQPNSTGIIEHGMIPHEIVERNAMEGIPMIKAWRQYLGLTQAELAERAGMAQPSLARLESKPITPRAETLRKLAKAMDLSIEQLEE